MTDYVTKKELEEVLDEHQRVILEAVNDGFVKVAVQFQEMRNTFERIEREMSEMRTAIRELATTVDGLAKIITDQKEEFIIMKAELDHIKKLVKEKWGVEISAAGWK